MTTDTLLPFLLLQQIGLDVQDLRRRLPRTSGRRLLNCLTGTPYGTDSMVRLRVQMILGAAKEIRHVVVGIADGPPPCADECDVVVPVHADVERIVCDAVLAVEEWWACRQSLARAEAGQGEIATHDLALLGRLADLPANFYRSVYNSAWGRHDAMLRTVAPHELTACNSSHAVLQRRGAAREARQATGHEVEAAQVWVATLSPTQVRIYDNAGCRHVDAAERAALMRRQQRDLDRNKALVDALEVMRA